MKTVFIDCGAYKGKLIKRFRDKHPGCKIYAFECNDYLNKVNYGDDVERINSAIWINEGKLPFYMNLRVRGIEGHSVYSDKTTGKLDKNNPVTVNCIDFSKWLINKFSIGEYNVHVKMNIEGAEYPVLEKCIDDNAITYINHLYVQWHYMKIPSIGKGTHVKLVEKLKNVKTLTIHNGYGDI
jgi:FkbM family methyltransferase